MKKLLIKVNGREYEVEVEVLEDDEEYGAPNHSSPKPRRERTPATGSVPPKPEKAPASAPNDRKAITSPINGVVIEIPVSIGQTVSSNDVLIVLEAMKMKTNISSPFAGKIKSIKVSVGETIKTGQEVLTFE